MATAEAKPDPVFGVHPDPKLENRRRRVFELRCRGFTIPNICEKLREEGFDVSERTVWEDLHSNQMQSFTEELLRRQFADMELSGSYRLKLEYRDRILDRLMPRKPTNSASVDVNVNQQSGISSVTELLSRYDAVLNANSAAEAQKRDLRSNCSSEQVPEA
ncbi:MAG TPA: hypothetical protein V6C97_01975 [Oculatellaceae cyanobacterium]